jgi:hypothetical protein
MNVAEPGSTGTLKSTMIIVFPENCGWMGEAKTKTQFAARVRKRAKQIKLKIRDLWKCRGERYLNFGL